MRLSQHVTGRMLMETMVRRMERLAGLEQGDIHRWFRDGRPRLTITAYRKRDGRRYHAFKPDEDHPSKCTICRGPKRIHSKPDTK